MTILEPARAGGAPVVIVGGGLAGWTIARELRQRDAAVPITLVCTDGGDFYSKPMLSNALALKKEAAQIVQTPGAQKAQGLNMRHMPCLLYTSDAADE